MIRGLEDALAGVRSAYDARIGGLDIGGRAEAAPRAEPPPAPRLAPLKAAPHINQIGTFVDALPLEQLPPWVTPILHRPCEDSQSARPSPRPTREQIWGAVPCAARPTRSRCSRAGRRAR